MDLLKSIVQVIVATSVILWPIASLLLFARLRWPAAVLWILKLMVSELSPLFILVGFMSVVVGLISGSLFITIAGLYTVVVFFIHFLLVTQPPQPADVERFLALQNADDKKERVTIRGTENFTMND